MRKLVLNCRDDRPIWAPPADLEARIRAALTEDWQITAVNAPASSRGDGGAVTHEAVAAAQGAEVYISAGLPRDVFLAALPTLRWAHTTTAGVASFLYPEFLASDVALTNSAGIHAAPMAESVIGMMLYFARGFDFNLQAQARGAWDQSHFVANE